MARNKNPIGKTASNRRQYPIRYRWRSLTTTDMLYRRVTTIYHGGWPGLKTNVVSEKSHSVAEVTQYQSIYIPTATPEQADNIGCPVVPPTGDILQTPVCQIVSNCDTDCTHSLARGVIHQLSKCEFGIASPILPRFHLLFSSETP